MKTKVPHCYNCKYYLSEPIQNFLFAKEYSWCCKNNPQHFMKASEVRTSPKWCPLRDKI